MGSVEIGDLISEQITISEENDHAIIENAQILADTDKEPDKKIDPDPATKIEESKNKNELKSDENGK